MTLNDTRMTLQDTKRTLNDIKTRTETLKKASMICYLTLYSYILDDS